MNVFCDHVGHYSLANSIVELFQNRLGYNLFFPSGQTDGFSDLFTPSCDQHTSNRITGEQFKSESIDLLICTVFQTEQSIHKLQKQYHPKAKVLRLIYNIHEIPSPESLNVLLGCDHDRLFDKPVNVMKYTPEHDHMFDNIGLHDNKSGIFILKNYFQYIHEIKLNTNLKKLKPIVANNLCSAEQLYNTLKNDNIHVDLHIGKDKQFLIDCIKKYQIYFHSKQHGGCGFTPREVLFAGLPLIVNNWYSEYHMTRAHKFFIDGENCIDIDIRKRPLNESVDLIKEWLQPDVYLQKCQHAVECSKKIIDYKYEASEIKKWIENLL